MRANLEEKLLVDETVFLTANGHGHAETFMGTDNKPALSVGGYSAKEVADKIIHLLSCDTAEILGVDLVKNGCKAFFSYNAPFGFYEDSLDDFLQPDAELVFSLANGDNAEKAFNDMMGMYDQKIKNLHRSNKFYQIALLETNKKHACSPITDKKWGDPFAII